MKHLVSPTHMRGVLSHEQGCTRYYCRSVHASMGQKSESSVVARFRRWPKSYPVEKPCAREILHRTLTHLAINGKHEESSSRDCLRITRKPRGWCFNGACKEGRTPEIALRHGLACTYLSMAQGIETSASFMLSLQPMGLSLGALGDNLGRVGVSSYDSSIVHDVV